MTFRVELSYHAKADLHHLASYIERHHSLAQAAYVVGQLEAVTAKLASFPERGAYPPELLALGIREYRQVLFKPYRLIYRIFGRRVVVFVIADGRRDLASLLAERLL
jgi:toxin ParE1/3/4